MSSATERASYSRARELIVEVIEHGATLEQLEHELIEPLRLSRDARDALWLLASATIERRSRHRSPRRWQR